MVTPGITIRDRLRVLLPTDEQNYYEMRGLVPPDLRSTLDDVSIVITNYHSFLPRTAREVQGVASNTRKLLRAGRPGKRDPFVETDEQIVDRVLRDLGGRGRGEVMVINDEAHHCYQDKPLNEAIDKEAKERNESARVWFRGLRAVAKRVGVKAIYDLSATPFYLGSSGYQEGYIFPWVVSDFSLMDAIESGIVKIPRIPVDDDVDADQPTYLRLWDHIGEHLPKRAGRKAQSDSDWVPPTELEGALRSLYRSYERRFRHWEHTMEALGEPPPVFIVVCPNTIVSKLVFDWIGGQDVERPNGQVTYSARVAGLLGLPFSFAHHFSAGNTLPALEVYRSSFRPSDVLDEPYVMLGVAVLCADTHERATYLAKPADLSFLRLRSGRPGRFPTPEEAADFNPTPAEREAITAWSASRIVGDPKVVRAELTTLVDRTGADELMVTTMAHGHEDRLRCYQLLAELAGLDAREAAAH